MNFRTLFIAVTFMLALICSRPAQAMVYNFVPSQQDIFDLDHYKYYTWGMNWQLGANESIVSAKIFIDNINNWQVESNDRLYIHLLDSAALGLTVTEDNQGGGDNFASMSNQILLDVFTDLQDDPGPSEDYSYYFSADEIAKLKAYSLNDGRIGLGFDPDCHYWNDGVKFTITTQTVSTPEPASMLLMGSGLIGALRLRRKK